MLHLEVPGEVALVFELLTAEVARDAGVFVHVQLERDVAAEHLVTQLTHTHITSRTKVVQVRHSVFVSEPHVTPHIAHL